MLRLTFIEIFARGIPEAFLIIFSAHVFSGTRINKKNFYLSILLCAILVYFIRLLPIQYGVNSILTFFVMIITTVSINKMDIVRSIKSCAIAFILEFICEGINISLLQFVFKIDIESVFANSELKIIYGLPSLLIYAGLISMYYLLIAKKRRGIKYGEDCK
ncbi:MAG: hypothetical protein ABRQ25_03360 [Clostridiaceae bacterium]